MITRKQAIKGTRKKWAECPPEDKYRKWWLNIGRYSCALCNYIGELKEFHPAIKCNLQDTDSCVVCCEEWRAVSDGFIFGYYDFKEAFEIMHDRIYNLKPEDLPEAADERI